MINIRNIGLSFDNENHFHKINGIYVPGCSSISKMIPKDWLASWASKMVVEKTTEELKSFRRNDLIKKSYFLNVLRNCKDSWKNVRDTAGDFGTKIHSHLEYIIKSKITGSEYSVPNDINENELKCIKQFLEMKEMKEAKWLFSELQIGHDGLMFAGIIDAIAVIDGEISIIDFKTTNSGVKLDYYCQIAGYAIGFEYMTEVPIKRWYILTIPRNGSNISLHKCSQPYLIYTELFMKCLDFHKIYGKTKNLFCGAKRKIYN